MEPGTIIVRGVNWLGDAVMSTPALLRLREKYPQSRIVLVTPEKLVELWKYHPAVDRLITFRKEDSIWKTARAVRRENAAIGIVFPNSFRSAAELWLGGVPRRIGFAGRWRTLLLNQRVSPPTGKVKMRKRTPEEVRQLVEQNAPPTVYPLAGHHIYHYLQLVGAAGANTTPLPPKLFISKAEVEAFRTRWNIPANQPWIGINAGAEYGPAKRWPLENFVETALTVAEQRPVRFLIFGGPVDVEIAKAIAEKISSTRPGQVVVVAGQTTLRELCAGLSCCRLVLTNDTGPMHLAAALGATVAVPFGSTSPELTGPGLPGSSGHLIFRSGVSCAPCFLRECPIDFRCMKSITPSAVAEGVIEKIG